MRRFVICIFMFSVAFVARSCAFLMSIYTTVEFERSVQQPQESLQKKVQGIILQPVAAGLLKCRRDHSRPAGHPHFQGVQSRHPARDTGARSGLVLSPKVP